VLYIPWIFDDLAFRVGNPGPAGRGDGLDPHRGAAGSHAPQHGLAAAADRHRLHGLCAGRAVFPGLLKHAGASWSQLINHQYLTSQGIYGVAVGVVATYVFHFVLFGVLATRIGLGQLFLDVASSIAGRYAGGPAKVSVFGSAMFGMLSGSSVANAVTVGSLTIPAMIRVGYKREFAGAVEAASSTGGQITPPVLGAAAFLMIEFLSVPYQTIIVAAAMPAFMHFFGVFMQVHFEAKRYGLRGLTDEEMPKLRRASPALAHADPAGAADRHPGQRAARPTWRPSPASAPAPSSACAPVRGNTRATGAAGGAARAAAGAGVRRPETSEHQAGHLRRGRWWPGAPAGSSAEDPGRIGLPALVEAFSTGAKYALAVGAAAATVGIVIGVVTLTGVGFKLSTIITGAAQAVAGGVGAAGAGGLIEPQVADAAGGAGDDGLVCILLGCGIPPRPTTSSW
jgi:TRAP-type uncharacterized transport system fused permease subunit